MPVAGWSYVRVETRGDGSNLFWEDSVNVETVNDKASRRLW